MTTTRASPNTSCLFQHETLDVSFFLVVDDFGVRYGTQSDADHLIATLRANACELTIKETGNTYLGMNISFGPDRVSLSMPGYIDKALQRFRLQYLLPTHRVAVTPGKYHAAIYPRIQLVKEDKSLLLTPTQRSQIQAIVGTLLYYAHAVDPSLLPIANEVTSQQANPTSLLLTFHSITLLPGAITASPTTPATCISFFTWTPLIYLGLMLDLSSSATSFGGSMHSFKRWRGRVCCSLCRHATSR
jgi:hypothetical protein